jgi:hypothetical protein
MNRTLVRAVPALLVAFAALQSSSPAQDKKGKDEPKPFSGRTGEQREKAVEQLGGSKESEAAVDRGLKFLADHQAPDGHWGLDDFNKFAHKPADKGVQYVTDRSQPNTSQKNDIAATGLALLPFLARGHTQKPAKDANPDYSKTVGAGITYLIRKQAKDGAFTNNTYAHAIATIAICEAYGMTADPMLKNPAQAAVRYIEMAQDPTGGGWRYAPRQPGDLSVTGWMMTALVTAKQAGLMVKPATFKLAEKFVDSCETAKNAGTFCYTPGAGATPSMTAVGLLCRVYLGANPRNPSIVAGLKYLQQNGAPPVERIYYQYYATLLMRHLGGDAWKQWNLGPDGDGKNGIRDWLLEKADQGDKIPEQAGTWMIQGDFNGGRLMVTSMALMSLESYYRFPAMVEEKEK